MKEGVFKTWRSMSKTVIFEIGCVSKKVDFSANVIISELLAQVK